MDPMTLPSSYLPSLDNTLSKTEISLAMSPTFIVANVLSIRSSIFVWYLCCKYKPVSLMSLRHNYHEIVVGPVEMNLPDVKKVKKDIIVYILWVL